MEYYYKSRNKFSHIVEIGHVSIAQEDEIGLWLEDNIGKYKVQWFVLKRRLMKNPKPGKYMWRTPLAFKTKENAMAFKLAWG